MTFGRESRLPIDEMFEEVQRDRSGSLRSKTHQQFVNEWRSSMAEAFRVARERNAKSQEYNKGKYDSKVKEVGIVVGDQVLVKNLREKGGTGKLSSHWERQVFKVIKQQEELPVYHVQSVRNPRDVRVLHRNHLMKCEQLSADVFEEEEEVGPVKKSSRQGEQPKQETGRHGGDSKGRQGKKVAVVEEESDEEGKVDSEDEDPICC